MSDNIIVLDSETNIVVVQDENEVTIIETSKGQPGVGVIAGGNAGEILSKLTGADYDTQWIDFTSASVSLTNKIIDDITNTVHADTIHAKVRNVSGGALVVGQPIKLTGWNLGQDVGEVDLANQATDIAIGIVEAPVLNNENGVITVSGFLRDVDTSAWLEKDILYVDGTGFLTNIRPLTGFVQPIAYVWRSHALNGILQVLATYPLQDADDVRYTGTLTAINVKDALDELDTNKITALVDDTTPELGGTLDCVDNDIDNAKTITFNSEIANTGTGAQTVDWNNGQKQKFTISGATTITFTPPQGASNLVLKLINPGSDIAWGTTILWAGGVTPSWSTTGTDLLSLYYDGTNYYGMFGLSFS